LSTAVSTIRATARRALGTAFACAVVLGTPACTRTELPDGEDLADVDLTPSAELLLVDDGSPLEVEVDTAAVLLIRNDDAEPHRLRGEGFDTGLLEPGDETLVTFAEPATIEFTDHLGDLTGTITVSLGT
jgi:hypothetical protein